MSEGIGLTKEELQASLEDISRAAEDLSRIASRLQEAYGRESSIGREAQKAAETVSFFRRDLKVFAEGS